MIPVYVGVGSNIRPRHEIRKGLNLLAAYFGPLTVSPTYRSAAIGFDGPDFINLVVRFDTALSVESVILLLQKIERRKIGYRSRKKLSSRLLDLDLLLYGELCIKRRSIELPRTDIAKYAYVLWPLSDIAPQGIHPALGVSFCSLKAHFSPVSYIHQISFTWQHKKLPII